MIKAHVLAESYPPDQIGIHEFVALPQIGSSISVIDKNSNAQFLRVTDVRMRGLSLDSDAVEILRLIAGDVQVTVIGVHNSDWSREAVR